MAIASVVAVVAVAGLTMTEPRATMPAGPVHAAALPENIYTPSRWLSGTAQSGALGRLAVLARAPGRHGDAAYGVSATDGTYRFLDLPERIRDSDVALSPDGRYVAYWTAGHLSGASYGNTVSDVDKRAVAGFGVYDSVTGRTSRHVVGSAHGIEPDAPGLTWLGGDRLMVSFSILIGPGESSSDAAYLSGPDTTVMTPSGNPFDYSERYVMPDGSLVGANGTDSSTETYFRLTDDLLPTGSRFTLPAGGYPDLAVIGKTVVVTGYTGNGGFERPRVGTMGADDSVRSFRTLGTMLSTELLGWRADGTILVAGVPGRISKTDGADDSGIDPDDRGIAPEHAKGGLSMKPASVYDIDLASGAVKRLGTAEAGQQLQIASTLLNVPMVDGRKPPHPLDPRLRNSGIAAVVLVIGWGAWLWRRRKPWRHYLTTEWQRSGRA
jgi:hypothetical protein